MHDDEVRLGDYLDVFKNSRSLILALLVAGLLIGVCYALLAQPQYTASGLLQLQPDRESDTDFLSSDIETYAYGVSKSAPEIEVLQSRKLLIPLLVEFGLDIEINRAHLLGSLLPRNPGLVLNHFEVPRASYGEDFELQIDSNNSFLLKGPDGSIAAEGSVGVPLADLPGTALDQSPDDSLSIVIESAVAGETYILVKRSPLNAVNTLQDQLTVREKTHDSGVIELLFTSDNPEKSSAFLNRVMASYLEDIQQRNATHSSDALHYVEAELPQLKNKLDIAESALNQYRQENGTVDIKLEIETLTRRRSELESMTSALLTEKMGLAQRYTPSHPRISEIAAREKELRLTLDGVDQRLKSLPRSEQTLEELEREVHASSKLYGSLLNTAQALRIAQRSPLINARVIDPALTPDKPASPNKPLVIILGLLIGLVLGIFIAFARAYFRSDAAMPNSSR